MFTINELIELKRALVNQINNTNKDVKLNNLKCLNIKLTKLILFK